MDIVLIGLVLLVVLVLLVRGGREQPKKARGRRGYDA